MIMNIVFLLISIAILAVIYIFLRKRIDKLINNEKLVSEMANSLDVILSEINQATERNILVIEDKIAQLQQVINDADKRISLLKNEKIKIPSNSGLLSKENKEAEDLTQKKQSVNLEVPKKNDKNEDDLTYTHLNRMSVMSGMVSASIAKKKKETPDKANEKEHIIALYKSGIDATIIAKNVGISLGEVKLVISLYKQTNRG